MILSVILALVGSSQLSGKNMSTCEKTPVRILSDSRTLIGSKQDAAGIADIILSRIYGAEKIEKEKPFRVAEDGEKYTVEGVLPRGSLGGTARIEICKMNAKVVYISHSK